MRILFLIIFFGLSNFISAQRLPELIPFVQNNKWGYCDSAKTVIIPAQFYSAEPFENGKALVWDLKVKEKYFIDSKANRFSTPYTILMKGENNDYIITDEDGNYGLLNQQLQVLVKPGYTGITSLHGSFIELSLDLKSGIYNVQTKKWVLPLAPNNYTEHIFGPFYGMMDENMSYHSIFNAESGKVILKDITYAYPLSDRSALVLFQDGLCGIMDRIGNILFKTDVRLCYPANENRIGFTDDEKKYGFLDFKGKMILEPQYDFVFNFIKNRAVVSKNDKFGVIDTSGNWIIEPEYQVLNHWFNDFSENILPLNKNDSTYLFDSNGEIINVIPKIESLTGFENQMMCVIKDLKYYAFMNEKGNFISDYKFSSPSKFINGLAKVTITNSDKSLTVYYIDKYGTEYIFKD